MLNPKDFEDTLMMLNTVNAPALAVDLAKIIPRIWEDAKTHDKGTSWVANHPIMVLWIAKISDIQHGSIAPYEKWEMAYNYVKMRANQHWVGKIWSTDKEYEVH